MQNPKTKRRKFVSTAERRTRNAIQLIRTIGKLANHHAYDYSDADVDKIAAAINAEIEKLEHRMLNDPPLFTLEGDCDAS
jgi:hypothetical protein